MSTPASVETTEHARPSATFSFGRAVPSARRVPSLPFHTTSTGFSITALRAYCIPQPIMRFAWFSEASAPASAVAHTRSPQCSRPSCSRTVRYRRSHACSVPLRVGLPSATPSEVFPSFAAFPASPPCRPVCQDTPSDRAFTAGLYPLAVAPLSSSPSCGRSPFHAASWLRAGPQPRGLAPRTSPLCCQSLPTVPHPILPWALHLNRTVSESVSHALARASAPFTRPPSRRGDVATPLRCSCPPPLFAAHIPGDTRVEDPDAGPRFLSKRRRAVVRWMRFLLWVRWSRLLFRLARRQRAVGTVQQAGPTQGWCSSVFGRRPAV
jgi:hypothetical protein